MLALWILCSFCRLSFLVVAFHNPMHARLVKSFWNGDTSAHGLFFHPNSQAERSQLTSIVSTGVIMWLNHQIWQGSHPIGSLIFHSVVGGIMFKYLYLWQDTTWNMLEHHMLTSFENWISQLTKKTELRSQRERQWEQQLLGSTCLDETRNSPSRRPKSL
jgi:hypothetical protein